MPHWNSKQRGQACLIALGLATWLALLALGQFQTVLLPLRAAGFNHQQQHKDLVLQQAPHELLLNPPQGGHGTTSFEGEKLWWEQDREEGQLLRCHALHLRFSEHDGWPQRTALLVEGPNYYVCLLDYQ